MTAALQRNWLVDGRCFRHVRDERSNRSHHIRQWDRAAKKGNTTSFRLCEEAAENRLAGLRRDERRGAPSGFALRPRLPTGRTSGRRLWTCAAGPSGCPSPERQDRADFECCDLLAAELRCRPRAPGAVQRPVCRFSTRTACAVMWRGHMICHGIRRTCAMSRFVRKSLSKREQTDAEVVHLPVGSQSRIWRASAPADISVERPDCHSQ